MDHTDQAEDTAAAGLPSAAAARRAPSPWRAALAGLILLPMLLACTIGLQTTTVRLDRAPAASLRVSLRFDLALVPGQTTDVRVRVTTIQGTTVELTGGQTLALDGVPLVVRDQGTNYSDYRATVPRRAPGGPGYTFTYTDEKGQQTVVHIPAPQADFAVLEPTAGSRVPLPRPAAPSRNRPVATPTPNLADHYQPRPPALGDAPLTLRYSLPYPPESVLQSSGPTDAPNQYTVQLDVFGPCAYLGVVAHGCTNVVGSMCELGTQNQTAPTGSATIDDRAKPWGDGFETCAPGPGEIRMSTYIAWNLPTSAFWGFYAQFADITKVPITWV